MDVPSTMRARPGRGALSRARRLAFRATAASCSLLWLTFCFGIIDLAYLALVLQPSGSQDATTASTEVGVLEVAYGAVATFMVAVAFLQQAWAPRGWPVAAQQVLAVALAFLVAGSISLDPLSMISVVTLLLMQVGLLFLYPGTRPSLVPRAASVHRPLLIVAATGTLPWLAYAWTMAANGRAHAVPEEDALRPQAGGWAGAAAMAFAVLLLVALAAMRDPPWRLPLWTATATGFAFAAMSVRFPTWPGSPGQTWGAAVAVWCLALLVAGEGPSWRARLSRRGAAPAGRGSRR